MRRTVTCRKMPMWLLLAVNETFFGYAIRDVVADRQADGTWHITLTIDRLRGRIVYLNESLRIIKSLRVYSRLGCISAVRLGWLLLWSKQTG